MSIAFYARLPDGTTVSSVDEQGPRFFNLANANAGALLGWLGYVDAATGKGLWDADPVSIAGMRRAIVKARNTDTGKLWTREERRRPGLVEHGLGEERLREYLEHLESFLLLAESRGAKKVRWA